MTSLNLTALAEELALPEAVLGPLAQAAEPLPEGFPYERLASPETAEGAWRDITARLPAWEEDGGMAGGGAGGRVLHTAGIPGAEYSG